MQPFNQLLSVLRVAQQRDELVRVELHALHDEAARWPPSALALIGQLLGRLEMRVAAEAPVDN